MECRVETRFDWKWGPSTLQHLGKAQALRVYIHISTYRYIYIYIHTYTYIYIYLFVYFIYIHIYIKIYIYIHVYTHISFHFISGSRRVQPLQHIGLHELEVLEIG